VKASALSKAVEFMTHYAEEPMKDLPKPLRTSDMADATTEWYANFVKSMENEPLFELILAANFMDISPLLDLTTAAVAIQFRDAKTPQDIARKFGITREYKEPDDKRIRELYPWSTI
jgi:S-phase kinase-associated protein 1